MTVTNWWLAMAYGMVAAGVAIRGAERSLPTGGIIASALLWPLLLGASLIDWSMDQSHKWMEGNNFDA